MVVEYIYVICKCLDGTTQDADPENPGEIREFECPRCDGTGKVLWGYLQDELEGE